MDNVSQWQSSVQFSLKDRIYALGKAYMRSTPSLRSSPGVADETVPVLFWLTMVFSRPVKEERSPSAFFPLCFYASLFQAIDGGMLKTSVNCFCCKHPQQATAEKKVGCNFLHTHLPSPLPQRIWLVKVLREWASPKSSQVHDLTGTSHFLLGGLLSPS